jgi:hypothetical protein
VRLSSSQSGLRRLPQNTRNGRRIANLERCVRAMSSTRSWTMMLPAPTTSTTVRFRKHSPQRGVPDGTKLAHEDVLIRSAYL